MLRRLPFFAALFFRFLKKAIAILLLFLGERASAWLVGEREIERQRNGSAVKR